MTEIVSPMSGTESQMIASKRQTNVSCARMSAKVRQCSVSASDYNGLTKGRSASEPLPDGRAPKSGVRWLNPDEISEASLRRTSEPRLSA